MNERLKELRKLLRLSQEEFGKRIRITKASVSRLESGENNPSDQTVMLVCREFDVNETWLRTGEGEMFKEVDAEVQFAEWAGRVLSGSEDSFQKRFARMMMSLTDDQWKLLEEKARMLFEEEKKRG